MLEKYGSFGLFQNDSSLCQLKMGPNLICIKQSRLIQDKRVPDADAVFVINIEESGAYVTPCWGELEGIDNYEKFPAIYENIQYRVKDFAFKFQFECDLSKIEDLINVYMDGNLLFPLDMDRIFYNYARQLKITDRTAISNVMAVIDIPEIDEL